LNPTKPEPCVICLKCLPGGMSRPHFHPNDRFFTVISGIHYVDKIRYDGAKGEECVIQVSGMGPATSIC